MKITFLGTGTSQGVPVIGCKCEVCRSKDSKDKRLRTSIMVETEDLNIVIDSGPDFRQQMLRENVEKLDAIIFTHEHKDHIGGLDDVRAFNYTSSRPIDVYAEERVERVLLKDFDYAFGDDKYPGVPDINLHRITEEPFKINDLTIIPIRHYHAKLPIFGFRIQNMCYITDIKYIEDNEIEKIKGVDVLIVEALRKKEHISHFTLQEAFDFINKLKPRKAYLTHISHYMGLHEDVSANDIPFDNIELGYDGLKIEI